MNGWPSHPIRAVHCFQTRSDDRDSASAMRDLLKLQNSEGYSRPPDDAASPQAVDMSRKVLDLKLTNQSAFPLDAFRQILELASTDQLQPLVGALYAVLTVPDQLNPENAPLRFACSLRIGRQIPWDIENDANCYELVEHAIGQFFDGRSASGSPNSDRVDFVFQGERFYATATPMAGNKSLIKVFNSGGCERMQAFV